MKHTPLSLNLDRPAASVGRDSAYAQLLLAELGRISPAWRRRFMLHAAAAGSLAVAGVLAGVAALLWAALPVAQMNAPWALVGVPLLPAMIAAACLLALPSPIEEGEQSRMARAIDALRQQLQADMDLMRPAEA